MRLLMSGHSFFCAVQTSSKSTCLSLRSRHSNKTYDRAKLEVDLDVKDANQPQGRLFGVLLLHNLYPYWSTFSGGSLG
jgi:hypothetical protein